MNTEPHRRYKRAHWRASARLIDAHRGEFLQLLAEERDQQAPACDEPRPALTDDDARRMRAELAALHRNGASR